jgi:hypothetical protein
MRCIGHLHQTDQTIKQNTHHDDTPKPHDGAVPSVVAHC